VLYAHVIIVIHLCVVGVEVIVAVTVKIAVFWVPTVYILERVQRFGVMQCLQLQSQITEQATSNDQGAS
jgi:hypothetical protein